MGDIVNPDKLVSGYKADEDKARMDLIPPEGIFALAAVLGFGAAKYADRNWEKGMKWSRPFAACMRHMWAWWGGKGPTSKNFLMGDLDPETKFSHLWHALTCIVFLVAYEERSMVQWDDRFTGPDSVTPADPFKAARIAQGQENRDREQVATLGAKAR